MLDGIKPTQQYRIMDLLAQTGIETDKWKYKRDGTHVNCNPAANPNYCYEWGHIEPGQVSVLCLWFDRMEEESGTIIYKINFRQIATELKTRPSMVQRSLRADKTIQQIITDRLLLRVVIGDGDRVETDNVDQRISRVKKRLLDPKPWTITSYNPSTGDCVLTRGTDHQYVDQFDYFNDALIKKTDVTSSRFQRSIEVRKRVLERSAGCCEFCGEKGFKTFSGGRYLETHHIKPLSEGGPDSLGNVIALCPSHHREAHLGEKKCQLFEEFEKIISNKLYESGSVPNSEAPGDSEITGRTSTVTR